MKHPPLRALLVRAGLVAGLVAGVVAGVATLALAFMAYLRPAFILDLANRFILCL